MRGSTPARYYLPRVRLCERRESIFHSLHALHCAIPKLCICRTLDACSITGLFRGNIFLSRFYPILLTCAYTVTLTQSNI